MRVVPSRAALVAAIVWVWVSTPPSCLGERGYIVVQVQDAKGHPVRGIDKVEGIGGSGLTGDDGEAKLSVGNATNVGDWVSLTLLH